MSRGAKAKLPPIQSNQENFVSIVTFAFDQFHSHQIYFKYFKKKVTNLKKKHNFSVLIY